jgi:pilus assembly protein FimV
MLIYLLLKITKGWAVRKMPYKTWLLVGFSLLMPWVAHAAGLGKLTILSSIGRPLLAEIELVSVQKDELATVTARLATPEAFAKANIQYSPALTGARVTIERRADGQPYIKIVSTRTVSDPFINLLIELSWSQGRLVREYTVLVDPPAFVAPEPTAAPPVAVAPPAAAIETAPITPAPQEPAVAAVEEVAPVAKLPAAPPVAAPAKAAGKEYGPVKRGDTLSKIAASVKPDGVTLEQMLVSLYRSNPDAFVGNMNRLKTGRILRVPEKEQISNLGQSAAVKEVRVQAANWNTYRQKLADAAGQTPARESKSAASGKITTAVEDKAAGKEAPKEVVKLSKSEPVAGKAGSSKGATNAERVRMLEEEATARQKALAEANDRVVQLEKTIKDMQRLLEIKGQVPGVKPVPLPPGKAEPAKAGPAKAEPAKAEPGKIESTKAGPAKAEPVKAEPAKAEPAKAAAAEPAKDAGKAPAEAPKTEQKAEPAPKPVAAESPKGEPPKSDQTAQPKPKPKIVAPPPQPDLIEQLTGNPVYLAGGGILLAILGFGGYLLVRRRRAQAAGGDVPEKAAPKLGKAAAAATTAMDAAPVALSTAVAVEDVDPLAEADLYLNFGRDAQAEEVLKEALGKNPNHEAVQLKLLQIYAGRKDKAAFEKIARNLHAQTKGAGDNWLKAVAMGWALDSGNALYEAGKSAPAAAIPVAGAAAGGTDLDFDLELSSTAATPAPDLDLSAGTAPDSTMTMKRDEVAAAFGATQAIAPAATAAPDFTLNAPPPPLPEAPDISLDAGDDAAKTNMIDFNFETPSAPPAVEKQAAAGLDMDFNLGDAPKGAAAAAAPAALEPDFKLDIGGATVAIPAASAAAPAIPELKLDDINLNLDDAPKAAPAEGGAKDDHWYDVQTKFDLAKAYQEMGDKDGASEILREVIKEGDAGQQAEAKKLLDSLG